MKITKKEFCKTKDGHRVFSYELENKNGMRVRLGEIGAAILGIDVPDRTGRLEDVVLGFNKPEYYFKNWQGFGAVIGRCANRIDKSEFVLNGKKYKLDKSFDGFTLHSGWNSYQYRIWESVEFEDEVGLNVRFHMFSPDKDQGYPGNLSLDVTYTLDNSNVLSIKYTGNSDKDTLINPTNHCYFNLAGYNSNTIFDHYLTINSSKVTKVDKRLMPTGELVEVSNTPFDFRKRKKIGADLDKSFRPVCLENEYDINYEINTEFGNIVEVARLEEDNSRRGMKVYTDMPGMQFYTANALDEKGIGKNGTDLIKNSAACFETQFFPNAINTEEFIKPILKAAKRFVSTTKFEFYTY